ncbi:uncharacterized protein LOC6559077 [Drosophila grimshawi]|uniref:GH20824 n=1 Tax=Drosophila grimshawi TaxID=7222 RepID=B4J5V1_DROGR|nr:uncharacterized protein LOC6559077 [Drosophila grimshawi]EDW00794.1 GH20824 [Drosophila grimshawi]
MPSKSVSAVQRLTQTLRHYSERKLMRKAYDELNLSRVMRAWPRREENFAAVQLLRQSRNWNNYRRHGIAGYPIRRNNILSHRSACIKRRFMDKTSRKRPAKQVSSEMLTSSKQDDSNQENVNDTEQEVRALRDVIFGGQDNIDDEYEKQRQADAELLHRVYVRRPVHRETVLSKKVIAPYSTYRTHRNSWGEFRHRMIYGELGF